MGQAPESARRRYEDLVRRVQRAVRVPAIQVALHRADRPLWTFEVGDAGGVALGPDTQFRIGSITKTFTAVLVLQCRDDGLLDLDDPVSAHLAVPAHGELTIRRLLGHIAGLQREPYGDLWDTLATPSDEQTIADLAKAERILAPGRRFHYSNLGFALLGHVVAAKRNASWADLVTERIAKPLGLSSLSTQPGDKAATGYMVDAWSDHARPEPRTDTGGLAPAAQLWGTAAELAKWGAFLADPKSLDPDGAVLAADTIAEMRYPQSVRDERLWGAAFGLGLILRPVGERNVNVGHDGAMPGFLAEAYGRVPGPDAVGTPHGLGVAVMLSSGTASDALGLAGELLGAAIEHDPAELAPWRIGTPAPVELRSILGHWWGEGFEYVFRWRNGHIEANGVDDPPGTPPAVFAVEGHDLLRSVGGREIGEQLRLTRDAKDQVIRMHWATYRFTRQQESFDGAWVSEPYE